MDLLHTLLSTLLSITATIVFGFHALVGAVFPDQKIVILPPVSHPVATTTIKTPKVATTSATSSPTKKVASKPVAKTVVTTPIQTPVPTSPPTPSISAEELNTQTRSALVNILCITQGSSAHAISGSGVLIDGRGVVLTNAHIGQYFLIKDYPSKDSVDCTIRTGSPAQPQYRATLLYLPPAWIADNASQIIAEQGKGTGENDYAFLLITGPTGPTPLPASFSHIGMTMGEPDIDVLELLAAYPAGFLDGQTIQKNLYVTSAYAAVKELFTFGNGRDVDLVSVGGTIVSQGGSSGGAMVRANDGKLQGIIATATTGDTTSVRDLRAITLGHIDRSLIAGGQKGIAALLSQDLTSAAAQFTSSVAPAEKEALVKFLDKR